MATYVLVHGANLGGWCWRLVTPALIAGGHRVYAPSLTGCGDRAHLLTREVGLETWVEDVCNLMFYEDLDNVVLVGHSNGGADITGVADRMPQRIAHVVYLDASILRDGESIWGLIPEDARGWMEKQLEMMGETWKSPGAPPEAWAEMARAEGWSEVIGRWAGQRTTPDPLKPGRDAIRLKGGEEADKLPRTYVRCRESRQVLGDLMVGRARENGWPVVDFESGHLPMFSAPRALAELLLEIGAPYGL